MNKKKLVQIVFATLTWNFEFQGEINLKMNCYCWCVEKT